MEHKVIAIYEIVVTLVGIVCAFIEAYMYKKINGYPMPLHRYLGVIGIVFIVWMVYIPVLINKIYIYNKNNRVSNRRKV